MRIICPNCDAQYEVPDDAIPEDGRDVQCSNCGLTWFESRPSADITAERAAPIEQALAEEDYDDFAAVDAAPPPPPPRKEIDPDVVDILRQEAAREQQARDMERGTVETQPDLGLDSGPSDRPKQSAQKVFDRLVENREIAARDMEQDVTPASSEDTDPASQDDPKTQDLAEPSPGNVGEAAATAAALGSRKELLPDIEEISSSLQSTEDRDLAGGELDPEVPVVKRKKRGFRRGFLLAFVLVVIAVLIYVFAPQIAASVPQSDPWLSQYVAWVDGLRIALDGQIQSVLKWLDETAASASN